MGLFGMTLNPEQDFINEMWLGCALTAYQQALQVGKQKDRDFIRTLAYNYYEAGIKSYNEECDAKKRRQAETNKA